MFLLPVSHMCVKILSYTEFFPSFTFYSDLILILLFSFFVEVNSLSLLQSSKNTTLGSSKTVREYERTGDYSSKSSFFALISTSYRSSAGVVILQKNLSK